MLGLSSASAGLMDNVSGRREFGAINIYERVLDTDGRTINIDNIATVSVGTIRRRLLRWLVWIAGGLTALSALSDAVTSFSLATNISISYASSALVMFLLKAAAAAGLIYVGSLLYDIRVLIIGASDGSRTVFRSRDLSYLEEVKGFLTRKINEQDLSAKLAADFKHAVSSPITQNFYGGTHVSNQGGVVAMGDGNKIAMNSAGAMIGDAINRVEGTGHRIGTQDTTYRLDGASGVQIGFGNLAAGNTTTSVRVDFSSVLPQVGELQRFYARQPGSEHVAERLADLERLMQSGAATREHKSQIRALADDIGHFLQAYPAMVQLFGHIGRLAGL